MMVAVLSGLHVCLCGIQVSIKRYGVGDEVVAVDKRYEDDQKKLVAHARDGITKEHGTTERLVPVACRPWCAAHGNLPPLLRHRCIRADAAEQMHRADAVEQMQ
jgi:hypothetical protein